MKKSIFLMVAICLTGVSAKADTPNIIERGNNFLKKNVYTDPVTTTAQSVLFGELGLSLALSAGLYKLNQDIVTIERSRIQAVTKAKFEVENIASRQVELAGTIEVAKLELKPLEAKMALLQGYVKSPAQALFNMEKTLANDLSEATNSLANMRRDVGEMTELTKNQILSGGEFPDHVKEALSKNAELIKKQAAAEVQLREALEDVRASIKNGNRLPVSLLNPDEIGHISRDIYDRKILLANSEKQLANLEGAYKVAQADLVTATKAVSNQGAVLLGKKALRAVGVAANLLVLADAVGSLYVINVLDRDPKLSSINTLAASPQARQKMHQWLEKQSP